MASMGVAIKTPIEHYDFLHSEPIATTIVWTKNRPENKWHKVQKTPQLELFEEFKNEADVFLTPNEFVGWRRLELLRSLRACYVDIDKPLTLLQVQQAVEDNQLPRPSAIVFSGRGWHLYWLIEKTPSKALPVWQLLQDHLISRLLSVGADPVAKDCSRVLRLVGSTNSKNGEVVWGEIYDPIPWKFHDLTNEILGYREPLKRSQPKSKAKLIDFATKKAEAGFKPQKASIYAWWWIVYQDLFLIAQSHPEGIPKGHRNNFLFLVAVAMSWFSSPETIEEAITEKASVWTLGLTDDEIRNACKCSLDRLKLDNERHFKKWNGQEVSNRYRFKRATLYQWLKDIIKPELFPQLRAIVDDETRANRRQDREKRRDRVAEGRHKRHYEGLNKSKPWELEGISRATWYRRKAQKAD